MASMPESASRARVRCSNPARTQSGCQGWTVEDGDRGGLGQLSVAVPGPLRGGNNWLKVKWGYQCAATTHAAGRATQHYGTMVHFLSSFIVHW